MAVHINLTVRHVDRSVSFYRRLVRPAPKEIDMRAVSDVFLPSGHGDDLSLLPPTVRMLVDISSLTNREPNLRT